MTFWDWLLAIAASLWLLATFALGVFDVSTIFGTDKSISKRIQDWIRNNPALSILNCAVAGFILGLAVHFEVQTVNYYLIEVIATAFGTVVGIVIWRLRKPGVPV